MNLILHIGELRRDLFEVIRVSEVVGAAVGGVQACQIEIAASLTRGLAITLDLAPLTLITTEESASVRGVGWWSHSICVANE